MDRYVWMVERIHFPQGPQIVPQGAKAATDGEAVLLAGLVPRLPAKALEYLQDADSLGVGVVVFVHGETDPTRLLEQALLGVQGICLAQAVSVD